MRARGKTAAGAAALITSLLVTSLAWAEAPPEIKIKLTPHPGAGPDSYLGVEETFVSPTLAADAPLVRLPVRIVGQPGAVMRGAGLTARDAQGPLALTVEEEAPTPQGLYRRWRVSRPTVGDVVLTYQVAPRAVKATDNNGPLFDLREESRAFAGAGVTFLAAPPDERVYRVSLDWDLSHSPAGSRGVSSLGEGHVDVTGPAERFVFAFYLAGPLKSLPQADADFAQFWMSDPTFDAVELGRRTKALHAGMASFFGDRAGGTYRVFIRQNPYPGTGGTALPGAFMFGYRASDAPSLDSLQGLLAHEMAHGWPAMSGEHTDTAWYSEGAAELYSMLLSYRTGVISLDTFVSNLNDKVRNFYQNPWLRMDNAAAGKAFWSDNTAQTLPYGRGLAYLLSTDAAIRQASRGKRRLDDVVLALYRRQKAGQSYDVGAWLALVGQEIGAERAEADFTAMVAGRLVSVGNPYGGCLTTQPAAYRVFDLGFDRASLAGDRIVRGLKAGSEAARAGVRDGDEIIAQADYDAARKDDTKSVRLDLKRDGAVRSVSFLPRGQTVSGLAFVKAAGADARACQF